MTEHTLRKPEILAADKHLLTDFREAFKTLGLRSGSKGWHTVKTWKSVSPENSTPLLIALMLEDIEMVEKIKNLKREKFFLIFQGKLPAKAIASRLTQLDVRTDKRIHLTDTNDENTYIKRLLSTLDNIEDDNHILDAWWEDDVFIVISPGLNNFNKLRVPLDSLPSLKGVSPDELCNFEIDEDGLFVYWPKADVHLGWEQFQLAIDSEARLKIEQQSDEFNKAYGDAIKHLRLEYDLRQIDIKGLTARQIGRIEKGECRATHSALTNLAKAHKLNIDDYLDRLAKLL